MFVPPAGEEHAHICFVKVMLVVNNPHDAVMDDVYHKRPSWFLFIKYGKTGNVTAEK